MTDLISIPLMMLLCVTTGVALWHSLTVINRMSRLTHHGVRLAYILKATGLFMVLLAVLDYMHGNPITWPWLLLTGVTFQTGGSALLHVATRRSCRCPECPIRKALGGDKCDGGRH